MPQPVRDRFDDVPRTQGRVGAHRAENPGMNGWVVLLWSVVAALILTVGGIFVAMVNMGTVSLAPEAIQSSTPKPKETGVVDTAFSVLVLNATGVDGLAGAMSETIVNAGWPAANVVTGDADVQDFHTTTVYYVAEEDRLAALGLAEVLGGVAIAQSDVYAANAAEGQKQLTVVIGLDRAPEAPAAPEGESPEEPAE